MAFIKDLVFCRSTLKEFNQKIPIAFAAASIKCQQKSIQDVAASNTSESKVKVVTNNSEASLSNATVLKFGSIKVR